VSPKRILLYTDRPILALGLAAALAQVDGYQLLAYDTPDDARRSIAEDPPDLLLLDQTPELTYAQLKAWDLRTFPAALWADDLPLEFAFQAMTTGIRGIVSKRLPVDRLLRALKTLVDGGFAFEDGLAAHMLAMRRVLVTKREGQLIELLSRGSKNKDIAEALGISDGTVKVYLSRLFDKVGVRDRFDLALWAAKNLGGPGLPIGRTVAPLAPPRIMGLAA
jgi:two-component system, NarL family, nitrate/nitrite response regulator NarL